MNTDDIIQRWEIYLTNIKKKAREILEQTEEASLQLIDPVTLETTALVNAWSAIELQLHDLNSQVEDTWGDKVSDMLIDAECGETEFAEQGCKRDATTGWIDRQREEMKIHIFAQAAKVVYQRAKEQLAKDYNCTQCSAPLPVPQQFFRASHVTCPACQKVNTFNPGTNIRVVESFCADHLAKQAVKDKYFHWVDSEKRMNDLETTAAREQAEKALRDYTEAYLQQRIRLVPEYAESYEKDLEGKMSGFYYINDHLPRVMEERERNSRTID